jgi:hypothetical protein
MDQALFNSAALYFGPVTPSQVPAVWLGNALELFSSLSAEPHFFDVVAPEVFSTDETYDFRIHKSELIGALNEGRVQNVGLYSRLDLDGPNADWRVAASIDMECGLLFLGVAENKGIDSRSLIGRAYDMGGDVLGVKYGFCYKNSFLDYDPICFAMGVSVSTSIDELRNSRGAQSEERRRLNAWLDETSGKRRYLSGMLRDVYSESLISREHVERLNTALNGSISGRLRQFVENKLWTWALADHEIEDARSHLQHLMIGQPA